MSYDIDDDNDDGRNIGFLDSGVQHTALQTVVSYAECCMRIQRERPQTDFVESH